MLLSKLQSLWIYRLRLLLAIRVQIAAHTQMLTDSAQAPDESMEVGKAATTPTAAATVESGTTKAEERRLVRRQKRNLDTLSSKLLQTYAVTFGFTVNRDAAEEGLWDLAYPESFV